jgi:hypothetical protein
MSAALRQTDLKDRSAGSVTGCHGNAVERRDRLNVMANATVAGLGSFLAGVMIETTTDTIHARRLRRKRPNNCRKAVRTTAMGRHAEGKSQNVDLS